MSKNYSHPLVSLGCFKVLPLAGLVMISAALGQTLPYLFEADGTGTPHKILWQTEPGVRYDLWKSANLANWSHVTGYPAVAAGLAMEYGFTPAARGAPP